MMKNSAIDFLVAHGIRFVLHEHPAVFTVKQSEQYYKDIPGLHCKNLFLKSRDDGAFFLVIMPVHDRMDMKALEGVLGVRKLSFASPDDLRAMLGLEPGSVSPLGMMNDVHKRVTLVITHAVWTAPVIGFHPNDNRATLEVAHEEFEKMLGGMQCAYIVLPA